MITRTLRTCLGLVLAACVAGGTMVPVAAQSGSPKAPAAASARKKAADPAAQSARPAPGKKGAAAEAAAPAPAVVPAAQASPASDRPPVAETYAYKSACRRDPFISLVNRASVEKGPPQKRPEGLRGLSFDEIALRGVYLGATGPIALVQGPDTKTYQAHVGDRMYDAVIKTITADSLVVLQEVNDPLSLQKQRERRKTLRVAEEVK